MNVALRKPLTVPQFLAWEERQALRYEFDGFQPLAMTGGTVAHATVQRNLAIAVGGRLRGKPCRFYGSDLKIEAAGSIRYPDGFVVCSRPANAGTLVTDPVVVFEILSESTAHTDLTVKNAEYRATPSIRRYVILEQTHIAALVFARHGEDWLSHVLTGADAVLALPEVGIELPLGELYADLDLAEPAPETAPA